MNTHDWAAQLKARGLGGVAEAALDALQPLGPLGAQVLWVLQPMARLLGGRGTAQMFHTLADALETPEGVAALRAQLRDEPE